MRDGGSGISVGSSVDSMLLLKDSNDDVGDKGGMMRASSGRMVFSFVKLPSKPALKDSEIDSVSDMMAVAKR